MLKQSPMKTLDRNKQMCGKHLFDTRLRFFTIEPPKWSTSMLPA
jgi:hypothetical protein